jgi:hypothetical protein
MYKEADRDTNSMLGDQDEFDMGILYFRSIAFTIDEWRLLTIYGSANGEKKSVEYFQRRNDILIAMMDLLAPKLTEDQEERYNKFLWYLIDMSRRLYTKNKYGDTMIDKVLCDNLDRGYSKIWRKFMRILQARGMLTKMKTDPRLAISELE